MENVTEQTSPPIVQVASLDWETARYPDEDFDRGQYIDIGGALGSQAIGLNIHRLFPDQENSKYHAHEFEEELFHVLDGNPTLCLDGRTFRLSKGHLIHCPPWSAHTFRNETAEPCEILMASNRCGRSDAVYPAWKLEERGATEDLKLDPKDPRVQHTAEMGWEGDPGGRHFGGFRNISEKMSLKAIACEIRTLRPGALIPYRAFSSAEAIYLLLEGKIELLRDGEQFALKAGDAVHVPPGCPHAFRLRSYDPSKLFVFRDQPEGNRVEHPTAPKDWEEPVRM